MRDAVACGWIIRQRTKTGATGFLSQSLPLRFADNVQLSNACDYKRTFRNKTSLRLATEQIGFFNVN